MAKQDQEQSLIKRGRYALYDPETGKPRTFMRTTRLCRALDDQEGLIGWTARFVAKGMTQGDDLLTRAASLDPSRDRGPMDRVWQEAKHIAGGSQAAEDGTTLHALSEAVDRGEDPEIPVKWRGHIERYRRLMDDGPLEIVPEFIERVTVNLETGTAGTFDRLCRVKRDTTVAFPNGKTVELKQGEYVVVDVKSSKSLMYSQVSFSIQFACYANSKWVFDTETETFSRLPEINTQVAFVAWIPSTKTDAELVAVDIEQGWEYAKLAVTVKKIQGYKKLLSPVLALKYEDPGTFEYRIKNARSKAELSLIWTEANGSGAWTPELDAMGRNRLRVISEMS